MAFSPGGVLLVTDMSDGTVLAFPDPKHAGRAENAWCRCCSGLNAPHGIAFHKGKLYVAEINAIRRYDWDESQLRAGNAQKIAELPGAAAGTRRVPFFLRTAKCTWRWDRAAMSVRKTISAARR